MQSTFACNCFFSTGCLHDAQDKQAAYKKRERGAKAAAKPKQSRTVSEHQLAAKTPTPYLLGRPGTSKSTVTAGSQDVEFEKMQHSFEAIRSLDQNEIDAAANLLLDHIDESGDSDDGQDAICDDQGEKRGLEH